MDAQAMQFVDIDEEGKLVINEDTIKAIKAFEGEIGVISVIGLSNYAKSFTLNEILGDEGFKVSVDSKPCTHGLWIWSVPLKHNGRNILLVDCEGSSNDGQSREPLTFLALLLSSSVINIQVGGFIRSETIVHLDFLNRVSSEIQADEAPFQTGTSAAPQVCSGLRDYFPKFVWLLRDYVPNKHHGTADEHLHAALELTSGPSDQVRTCIKELFPTIHCHTLPRPFSDESRQQPLSPKPRGPCLRPVYKLQRTNFVKFIQDLTEIKKVDEMA